MSRIQAISTPSSDVHSASDDGTSYLVADFTPNDYEEKEDSKFEYFGEDLLGSLEDMLVLSEKNDNFQAIKTIRYLKESVSGIVYYWILSIVSGGLFSLLCYWLPAIVVKLCFKYCRFDECDHVLLADGEHVLVESLLPLSSHVSVTQTPVHSRFFSYRHKRFVLSDRGFVPLVDPKIIDSEELEGLDDDIYKKRLRMYGPNTIHVEVPGWLTLLFRELFNPFFIFQAYSIILWCNENYYVFAGCIFVIASISIVMTLVETKKNLEEIAELADIKGTVTVIRSGVPSVIKPADLVPGDLVSLEDLTSVPCDICLVSGGVVVDESMLTGESIPVLKVPITTLTPPYKTPVDARHTLFSATKILQVKSTPCVGLCLRTGFETTKGSLIRSILYPVQSLFRFEQQSYRFIMALSVVACLGFIVTLVKETKTLDLGDAMLRALDLVTIVVPPSLPLAMSVGINFAMANLRTFKLFCISPSKINIAGKVRYVALDKTGTMTEQGMEFMGVMTSLKFGEVTENLELKNEPGGMFWAMLACHGITKVHDTIIGDPLEVKVFEACSASLVESETLVKEGVLARIMYPDGVSKLFDDNNESAADGLHSVSLESDYKMLDSDGTPAVRDTSSNIILNILKRYEFESSLQRSSVIVSSFFSGEKYFIVKGSPEMIKTLCKQNTIPSDYLNQLDQLTHSGFRVLAVASRALITYDNPVSSQSQLEVDLEFRGFILLSNQLKNETKGTLAVLAEAGIRNVMVTGDNPLTAIKVAKDAELVKGGVFVSRPSENSFYPCEFHHSDDPRWKLDPISLRPLAPPIDGPFRFLKGDIYPFELAITGQCFSLITQPVASYASWNDVEYKSWVDKVLLGGAIYARMTPDQKKELVVYMQQLGLYTLMIGDGANDCGALKSAHVGISLSETEASIAAPFTYLKSNISCIPVVLSEGRSSLVTCFQLFRYMAMYAIVQFISTILLYFDDTIFGDYQQLTQDLFIVFPLTIFMGSTAANHELSIKRPSANLLSFKNMGSMLVHMLICLAFQLIVYFWVPMQHGYVHIKTVGSWLSTSLYYLVLYQYIFLSAVFALGHPFKKPLYTNSKFTLCLLVCLGYSTLLCVEPLWLSTTGFTYGFLFFRDDVVMTMDWRIRLILLGLGSGGCSFIWECLLYPGLCRLSKSQIVAGKQVETSIFGTGKKLVDGGKLYHTRRQEFENSWML